MEYVDEIPVLNSGKRKSFENRCEKYTAKKPTPGRNRLRRRNKPEQKQKEEALWLQKRNRKELYQIQLTP